MDKAKGKEYKCIACDLVTKNLYNYNKHCKTQKHLNKIKTCEFDTYNNVNTYNTLLCKFCGFTSCRSSSMARHLIRCNKVLALKQENIKLTKELQNCIKKKNEAYNEIEKVKEAYEQELDKYQKTVEFMNHKIMELMVKETLASKNF